MSRTPKTISVHVGTDGSDRLELLTPYLHAEEFDDYRSAVKSVGARFDQRRQVWRIYPERLDALYTALVRAGFNMENTEPVVEMLSERTA